MPKALRYLAHSEIGLVRRNNQDSGYASPTMLMVADGMGGAAAGDLASAVAIRELKAADEAFTGTDAEEVLAGAIARANDQLADLVRADPALDGMGTTVCGLLFDGQDAALANIGDSRAYQVRDGVMRRITRDHSWVQTLVDDGRITEAEALVHPHRSLILRVLNGNAANSPDLDLLDVEVGDRLLICSDGLCGLVTDADIEWEPAPDVTVSGEPTQTPDASSSAAPSPRDPAPAPTQAPIPAPTRTSSPPRPTSSPTTASPTASPTKKPPGKPTSKPTKPGQNDHPRPTPTRTPRAD